MAGNSNKQSETGDFKASEYASRVEDLEAFRQELEGTKLYSKIVDAICESTSIQNKIKEIAWQSFKDKILWFILGAVGLVAIDIFKDWIIHFLQTIHS